jgi:hypothetical protein
MPDADAHFTAPGAGGGRPSARGASNQGSKRHTILMLILQRQEREMADREREVR